MKQTFQAAQNLRLKYQNLGPFYGIVFKFINVMRLRLFKNPERRFWRFWKVLEILELKVRSEEGPRKYEEQ